MKLTAEQISAIKEYIHWKDKMYTFYISKDKMYVDNSLPRGKDFGQFFTPPEWTDKDLYEYFNLTPEEISIIESEIDETNS